jgi:hypothetical protein
MEDDMGEKSKGQSNVKKPAALSLKEKRQIKKSKGSTASRDA